MKVKKLKTLTSSLAIGALLVTTSVFADSIEKEDKHVAGANYKQIMKQADADYSAAKAKCDSLKGNQKDVCEKDAKANYETVKADAKANRKTDDAFAEADGTKREAAYKAAKEQCKTLTGDAEDACIKQAKATYWQ